jgi:hypothetical protein
MRDASGKRSEKDPGKACLIAIAELRSDGQPGRLSPHEPGWTQAGFAQTR